MQSRLQTILAVSAALVLGIACDSRATSGAPPESDDGGSALAPGGYANTPQLERIMTAPTTTLYQGVRRVAQHWKIGDDRYDLAYRERVSADGNGNFAVDLLDVSQPEMSIGALNQFQVLADAREGFSYRYRDFMIHDLPGFLRNYVVMDAPSMTDVLGRPCNELTVRRAKDPQVVYHVFVDVATGLVLRCNEVGRDGVELGSLEYESLDFAPDLSQVAWHQALSDERPALGPPVGAQQPGAGASMHAPRAMGAGFTLVSAVELTNSSLGYPAQFVRYTYTDGVELVFLVYDGITAAPPDDVVVTPPSVGSWQFVLGNIRGQHLTAMGRLSHGDLLDLIASALY